jgi:hypothetical protein
MKVDGDFEMFPVAEATGHPLDRLNFTVEGFARCIGDSMRKERQNVGQVTFYRTGGLRCSP